MLFHNHYEQFLCFSALGFAVLLVGIGNTLCRSHHRAVRALISVCGISASLGAVWLMAHDHQIVSRAAVLIALVCAPFVLVKIARWARLDEVVLWCVRMPRVRWALVSACGMMIAVGSGIVYEIKDAEAFDNEMSNVDELATYPELRPNPKLKAITDCGRTIVVQEPVSPRDHDKLASIEESYLKLTNENRQTLIRQGSASDQTNCHGWVFTGGLCWVGGNEVDAILDENGYLPVETPQPGDLVVYRNDDKVMHTAIVRYVTPGMPVMVEGKWGATGIFLHAVEQSCYGNQYTFYRSPREGHVLSVYEHPNGDALVAE